MKFYYLALDINKVGMVWKESIHCTVGIFVLRTGSVAIAVTVSV